MTLSDIPDAVGESRIGTVAEWRAMGIPVSQLRSLVRSGELVRVRLGVYATKRAIISAKNDWRRAHALRVAAVVAGVGRDSVASHHSAAVMHGIDLLNHPRPLVTLTRSPSRASSRPRSDGIIFHTAETPPGHITRLFGIWVTTVPRTVVDLARTTPFMPAVVAADSALRAGMTTKAELLGICDASNHWPGVKQARQVAEFGDGLAESVLESCARVVFHGLRLERPELQVAIRGDGFAYRVDFYWARYRTIAEADGLAKYACKDDILAQFRRDRLLRDAGYKIVHFTWRELFETPDAVVARIRTAFSSPTPY